jgi:2-hydroxycyclohexanecarboxyl-CoA dehydrogenase
VVVVTGGGAGIGAATCRRLAAEGARVAVLDVDEGAAAAVAAECGGLPVRVDVGAPADVVGAVAVVEERFGPVEVLVNNAAVARGAELLGSDDAHWEGVLAINLLGVVRTTRAVLPGMRRRRRGSIVNLASLHAQRGYPGWSAYAAAKGGLLAFTRGQAAEQGPYGIRVNAISPGATATPLNEHRIATAPDPDRMRAEMAAQSVFGRMGTPEEVAAVIAFVASDDASFMTGSDIVCDGGAAVLGP